MRSRVIVSRRIAVVFASFFVLGLSDVSAQERFFTSPARGGADGARAAVQLQQETNRGIAHQISITAVTTDLTSVSATASSAVSQVSNLRAAVNVSLSSAGDVTCGNAGMLMGPSHTIAVNRCIPSLTIAPTGRVVLTQGVKLGSEGNCDASGAGTLRYEAAQRLVQFCDGTAWQEVGAAPAVSGPFTAVTGANPSTVITSNAVTVTGFAGTRTATATGGATIMVNGTAVGLTANVNPGDSVALRVTSSASFDTVVNVGFSVTSISANWSVTTRSQDTTPNSFTFTNLTSQAVSTTVMSDVVTVAGFDGPLSVSISGQGSPQIQIEGGSWVASGSINPGQTLRARLNTSSSFNTAHGVTVSLGTLSTNWTATTNIQTCTLPWGGTISHGQSVTAFQAACGTCASQSRTCSGGVLSGTFTNQSCASECNCLYAYQGGCATGPNPTAGSLLAAATDATGLEWGSFGIARRVLDGDNGAGNTTVLASYGTGVHPAASYCASLVQGGYDDWYLPAINEISSLYEARLLVGNFVMTPGYGSKYWSSTEFTGGPAVGNAARIQDFYTGYQGAYNKNYTIRVRCVRRAK